jgi:squalene-associated FAD-dependent desaturase
MPSAIVIGGGLSGLASAAALGASGFEVDLFEARGFLGGRATSYPLNAADGAETIDNCQHILLRCCVNLLDFYRRLGVSDRIEFHKDFYFIEPGGRISTMRAGPFPKPFHFVESFLGMRCFDLRDKIAIGRGLLTLRRERKRRTDLDRITMLEWLREKRQTPRAIDRFWRQVLVSAVNEDLDRMAARHGFQVFWLGFLASRNSYEMGVPAVPLADLYSPDAWDRVGNVRLHLRNPVEHVVIEDGKARGIVSRGIERKADYCVLAVPFERVCVLAPGLDVDLTCFTHSPITGIHLWFDREITALPHATLLDRTIQWMFNKGSGRYLELVVSASRGLLEMSRGEVIDLAVRELCEFFPTAREAKLAKAHVVKEVRATFSAKPGLEALRPGPETRISNLFLAGDWTRSGWPATMEGAVRSGYIAAEALTKAAGQPARLLLPDIA